jgi:polysaccharide export outer membrane protein
MRVIDCTRARSQNGAMRSHAWLAVFVLCALVTAADEYEVGPGDVLHVVVLGQPEMTGDFPVNPEGLMSFPVLGKIKASQMSARELERKLTTLLADGYIRRPQVTVTIQEYNSQRVFVTGEVQKPGPYALKADHSLRALLGDIGPLTQNAGHEVIVIRPPAGTVVPPLAPLPSPAAPGSDRGASPTDAASPAAGPGLPVDIPGAEVFHVSLQELQSGNPERNILLQAGDTVYVPRAAQIYIAGSVTRPGPYRFQEGMTLLQALTLAGGVTERGSTKRIKVIRTVGDKKHEVRIQPTDLVQPEDTIVVPERFF